MNICSKCFVDAEIIAIIESKKNIGKCDCCRKPKRYIYNTDKDTELISIFESVLDIYQPKKYLPPSFPNKKTSLLKDILYDDWKIFNLDREDIYEAVCSICQSKYLDNPELFDSPIGIPEIVDKAYLEEFSVIRNNTWDSFVDDIKYRNRYHTDHINKHELKIYFRLVEKQYPTGSNFYRGRLCSDSSGFTKNEMGAPPEGMATAGRANPEGISYLYLADSIETTLKEVRAGLFDFVTIGRFVSTKTINIVNLAYLAQISPFLSGSLIDFVRYQINIKTLEKICMEVARPLRRHDSLLDYLPTQYICDYIKSLGYDGIEYSSTMQKGGYNIALFDQKLVNCISVNVHEINNISYDHKKAGV